MYWIHISIFTKDFLGTSLTTQEIEDSSDEGDEVDMSHATDDTMTTLVTEPLQVVPDIVPE